MITIDQLNALFGFEFSARQANAITAPLEPSVIMAGAGSGKTSVMTRSEEHTSELQSH